MSLQQQQGNSQTLVTPPVTPPIIQDTYGLIGQWCFKDNLQDFSSLFDSDRNEQTKDFDMDISAPFFYNLFNI